MTNVVHDFEKKFANKLGTEYGIAVNSGTSALHAALEAIEVRHGEVIMPALCPGLVAFAIIHAGAWPVFADVDPQTHLVTDETIKPCIGSRTKAVIAVALHGLPTDIDRIRALCRPRGIAVIEDCAQCLLGRYKDSYAGTKSDVGCYSFERSKHITTGSEGGMILTNDAALAEKARKFSGLGYHHLTAAGGGTRIPDNSPATVRFGSIGINYRMSEYQAELGLKILAYAQDKVWLRQEIGFLWQNALEMPLQPHSYDADNTFYSAAWAVGMQENTTEGRLTAWKGFHDKFVEAGGDSFYAIPRIPYYEPALKEYISLFPNPVAIDLQQRVICLKTHYTLEEAKRQADILADMLSKAKNHAEANQV